jgi:hypothetical protein
VAAVDQAVVQLADELAREAAQGGFVSVAGVAAVLVAALGSGVALGGGDGPPAAGISQAAVAAEDRGGQSTKPAPSCRPLRHIRCLLLSEEMHRLTSKMQIG